MGDRPVELIPGDELDKEPEEGTGLCLSGGGYRAMVFHLGSLWRLYDARLLGGVKRISSVSGGSITAGVLGLNWHKLSFEPSDIRRDFVPEVVAPMRRLASETIDAEVDHPGHRAAGPRQRSRCCRLRRASIRRCHPAGPAGRAAVRHQRDQRPVRRHLALHEAVYARLSRRRGAQPDGCRSPARSPRPRPFRRSCRRSRCGSIPPCSRQAPARTCSVRRSRPRSCSPTAASTTTWAWRRSGSGTRPCWSATAGGSSERRRSPRATGPSTPTECST